MVNACQPKFGKIIEIITPQQYLPEVERAAKNASKPFQSTVETQNNKVILLTNDSNQKDYTEFHRRLSEGEGKGAVLEDMTARMSAFTLNFRKGFDLQQLSETLYTIVTQYLPTKQEPS